MLMSGIVSALSGILTSRAGPARTCEVKSRAKRKVKKVVNTRIMEYRVEILDRDSTDECFKMSHQGLTTAHHDYLTNTDISILHLCRSMTSQDCQKDKYHASMSRQQWTNTQLCLPQHIFLHPMNLYIRTTWSAEDAYMMDHRSSGSEKAEWTNDDDTLCGSVCASRVIGVLA